MIHKEIIDGLNSFLRSYFNLSYDLLKSNDNLFFTLEGTHDAVNHKRSDSQQIKTIHWFEDFYLYIEVKYNRDYSNKLISISVFQGDQQDPRKKQLFRAEWDDYGRYDQNRAQPHWHITRDKANYENFYQLINDSDPSEINSFDLFKMSNAEIFDTTKIHFAMSSNWQNYEKSVHKIDDSKKVVYWIEGLLEHIKYELLN
jgi:hypothetical protein